MARPDVHGPPYVAVRALGAWAIHRWPYLRGRLLLSGVRIDSLDAAEIVDAAEAAIAEPHLHGAFTTTDALLDKLLDALIEGSRDRDLHGSSSAAQAAASKAEGMFGPG